MADYYLKNIDPDTWKRFKAACALRGLTVRDTLLIFIQVQSIDDDSVEGVFNSYVTNIKKGAK